MFEFSSKTVVEKKFKLSELFKMISADKQMRVDAKCISAIALSNVLSNDTLNISDSGNVKEIYVFDLTLNDKKLPMLFISALDKAINLNTVFICHFENKKCVLCAYKVQTDSGVKVGKYYMTEWEDSATNKPLPLNITSLDDIYRAMFASIIPLYIRQDESIAQYIERFETITKLKKEIAKLQKQVDCEKQSKRRFELNAQLKEKQCALAELTA